MKILNLLITSLFLSGASFAQETGIATEPAKAISDCPIPEVNASFPGGADEMMKYLSTNLKYPAKAKENEISGTVYLSFVVNTDGSLSQFTNRSKSVDASLVKEAIRVFTTMPKWIPAQTKGEPVCSEMTVPVRFQLR